MLAAVATSFVLAWGFCGSAQTPSSDVPSPSVSLPEPHASGEPEAPAPPLIVREVARIPAPDAGAVDISGSLLTWTTSSTPRSSHNRVVVYNLDTGKLEVAATAARGSVVGSPHLSGTSLAYGEERSEAPHGAQTWRVLVKDIASGRLRVIDHGDGPGGHWFTPTVEISYPWVVWLRPVRVDGQENDIIALNLDTGVRRTLVAATAVGDIALSATAVIYVDSSGDRSRDLFTVELTGDAPSRLTTSGKVYGLGGTDGGRLVHLESWDGRDRVYVRASIDGPSVEVSLQAASGTAATLGRGFAAWHARGAGGRDVIEFVSLSSEREPSPTPQLTRVLPTSHVYRYARIAADGNRVVWGEAPDPYDGAGVELVVSAVSES